MAEADCGAAEGGWSLRRPPRHRGRVASVEEHGHQGLIVISAIVFQRLHPAAVFDKSCGHVEPQRGLVVADDDEMKLLDALCGMRRDRVDEEPPCAGLPCPRPHIHAPEHPLVCGLRAVLPAEAGGPHELARDERAEHVRYREALLEPCEWLVLFAFKRAGESLGIARERLQPDGAV